MTHFRPSAAQEEAGYTLLEVLVTLVLVAVLSAIMMTAIFQFRQLLRLESQIEAKLALQQTARHVVKLLEQAENIAILMPDKEESVLSPMEGGTDEVRFFAIARRGAYLQGLREATLRIEPGEGQGALMQVMAPRRFGGAAEQQEDRIELARQVTALTFSYFGAPNNADEPGWHSTWLNAKTLPIGISVRLAARHEGSSIMIEDFAFLGHR